MQRNQGTVIERSAPRGNANKKRLLLFCFLITPLCPLRSVFCSTALPFAPACHPEALHSFFHPYPRRTSTLRSFFVTMPSISKCFVLVSLALSVSALTTPHDIRNAHNHHHHHPVATPSKLSFMEPVVIPNDTPVARTVRRRSTSGRCKSKSSSTSHAASTPPANVGHAPPAVATHHSSSPTHKATHTSSADKPTSSKIGGGKLPSFMVGVHQGQGKWIFFPLTHGLTSCCEGTYYGTGLGACGITNNDNQPIVAVSHLLFDNYPYVVCALVVYFTHRL
jgi:hypothetical protein